MVLLFDLLEGAQPTGQFGHTRHIGPDFESNARRKTSELAAAFGVELGTGPAVGAGVEQIATQMWDTGWQPSAAEGSALLHDLGLVLTSALHQTLDGVIISRGSEMWLHTSIWWQSEQFEAFPFHKVMKRLTNRDGESTDYFWRSISKRLSTGRSG